MPEILPAFRLDEPSLCFDYEDREATAKQPYTGLRKYGPWDAYRRTGLGRERVQAVIVGREDMREELQNAKKALSLRPMGKLNDVFSVEITDEVLVAQPATAAQEAEAYRKAIANWLRTAQPRPALAFILHDGREHYQQKAKSVSPYYAAKALFLKAGIPTQSLRYASVSRENIERFRQFYLANILTACYAKTGGIPWVVKSNREYAPEITVGVGTTAVRTATSEERFVGISTIFDENGGFSIWDITPLQSTLKEYENALEHTIANSIRAFERRENREVRRIACHVSGKRAGWREVEAVNRAIKSLAGRNIEASIIHITTDSTLWLLDGGHSSLRPESGLLVPLRSDGTMALMHTTGRSLNDKGKRSFLARPLKLDIHAPRNNRSWRAIYQHIYDLRWMSWRGVGTATQPVTIEYPTRMASLLAYLHHQEEVEALEVLANFKNQAWFL